MASGCNEPSNGIKPTVSLIRAAPQLDERGKPPATSSGTPCAEAPPTPSLPRRGGTFRSNRFWHRFAVIPWNADIFERTGVEAVAPDGGDMHFSAALRWMSDYSAFAGADPVVRPCLAAAGRRVHRNQRTRAARPEAIRKRILRTVGAIFP